jgi:putative addiction module component (TIGR02574 family)
MTAALKSIAETVEQLPAKARIYLAERLLASLENAELEKEWADEAIRRRDEVRSGKVKPVPAAEVYRRIERLFTPAGPKTAWKAGRTCVSISP